MENEEKHSGPDGEPENTTESEPENPAEAEPENTAESEAENPAEAGPESVTETEPENAAEAEVSMKAESDSPARMRHRMKELGGRLLAWMKRHPAASSVMLLAVLFVIATVRFGRTEDEAAERYFYSKDNSLYGVSLSDAGSQPKEYTANCLEQWGNRPAGGILGSAGDRAFWNGTAGRAGTSGNGAAGTSENGIAGRTGTSGNGAVWQNSAGQVKEPLKEPAYAPSGRYLFYPERMGKRSFDLVRADEKKGEVKTLDSGVVEFIPAADGGVVYVRENGALCFYGENRKRKLSRQAFTYRLSEGGDALLWTEEGSGITDLFYLELAKKGEPVRLERGVGLLDVSPDLSRILVKKEDRVGLISDQGELEILAEDVFAAAAGDAPSGSFYVVRDIKEAPEGAHRELFYNSEGEETLLNPRFAQIHFQDKGVVVYTQTDFPDLFYLAGPGGSGDLDCAPALPGQMAVSENRLYFLSPYGMGEGGRPVYELCCAGLDGADGEDMGRVRIVDDGVTELACISGETACYYKETEDGIGDLYCEGELMAYDVRIGTEAAVPGGGVLCIADYSSEKENGTLYYASDGERNEIASDVTGYAAVSPEEILILSDYRSGKKRGDLYLYDGLNQTLIERDVWGIFGDGNGTAVGRMCR